MLACAGSRSSRSCPSRESPVPESPIRPVYTRHHRRPYVLAGPEPSDSRSTPRLREDIRHLATNRLWQELCLQLRVTAITSASYVERLMATG